MLLLGPTGGKVIVALGALQLHAHEERADGAGGAVRGDLAALADEAEEDDLRPALDVALDGEKVAGNPVPGGHRR